MGYKKDISKLPFTRRFISALSLGQVPNLDLPVSREDDEEAYRVCIAKEIAAWDQQVRVPFLGPKPASVRDLLGT